MTPMDAIWLVLCSEDVEDVTFARHFMATHSPTSTQWLFDGVLNLRSRSLIWLASKTMHFVETKFLMLVKCLSVLTIVDTSLSGIATYVLSCMLC